MYASYYDKEFIMVDRLSHRDIPLIGQMDEMQRGDVVIFAPGVSKERKYFIKRVIALPGETLKIENGRVYIKELGQEEFYELDESWYLTVENNFNTYVGADDEVHIYQIPENRYFVMWDNRLHSTDSRTCFQTCSVRWNYISPEEITGRIFLDLGYFDFSSFSFVHPEYGTPTIPKFFSSLAEYSY